jgi:dihydrofolate reductase
MRKLISSINVTVDGFCDHTAMIADDDLHNSANELLKNADTILFGRITYQLMESAWPAIVKDPTGNKAMDEFAVSIDNISKVVFSNTLERVEWKNTRLAEQEIGKEVLQLKQKDGKEIVVGSPSLIATLTKLRLIDEYRFWIHPVILGSGLSLFKNITDTVHLRLMQCKTFRSGVASLIYQPINSSHLSVL